MRHIEDTYQAAFIQWVNYAEKGDERLQTLFHPPNGGRRDPKEAARLKKQGVRAGVLDIILPWPCGGFTGLAIEFKSLTGTVSKEQVKFGNLLLKAGWKVVVHNDPMKAIQEVKNYLNMEL